MSVETPESNYMEQIAKEEEERKKQESLIESGQEVSVVRTSGDIETGWIVRGPHPERHNIVVDKKEGDKILSKEIPPLELYAQNRPEMESRRFAFDGWQDLWVRAGGDPQERFDPNVLERINTQGGLSPKEARDLFGRLKSSFEKLKESGKAIRLTDEALKQAKMQEAYFGKPVPPEFRLSNKEIREITGT